MKYIRNHFKFSLNRISVVAKVDFISLFLISHVNDYYFIL